MAKSNSNGGGKFVFGAVIGAAVGAITALLTAPKSGKETREDLKNKATEISHEAVRQLRKMEGELSKRISEVKRQANRLEGDAKREVDLLIAQAEKMKDQAFKMAEDIKNDAKKQLDDKFLDDARGVIADLEDVRDRLNERRKKPAGGSRPAPRK